MPVSYTIDPELKLLKIQCTGTLTDSEFFVFRAEVYADPAFTGTTVTIYDARRLTKMEFSTFALWKLAYEAITRPGARRAFVTPTEITAELGSTFQILRMIQGKTTFVTTDMRAAWEWLGLPLAQFADKCPGERAHA